MEQILETHNRFKGLPWYEFKKQITIGGAGGIGSWTSLILARQGHSLHIHDFDTIEKHNLGGQLFGENNIGNTKIGGIVKILKEFSPENNHIHGYNHKITEKSSGVVAPITISCFDNMETRKILFEAWYKAYKDNNEVLCVFIDGRLLAEEFQVYVVKNNEEDYEKYSKTIFDDNSIPDEDCTTKSTTHCSIMIASFISSLLNNTISNYHSGMDIRGTSFCTKVSLPMMFFEFSN